MKKFEFVTSCVDVPRGDVDSLHEMIDKARPIEYGTFFRHVDHGSVAALFGYERDKRQGLTLRGDWHIAYYSSSYKGKRCVYLVHSAIEYIFQEGRGAE